MTVGELISKMPDNYLKISVKEFRNLKDVIREWEFPIHCVDYTDIPEDVWNKEVELCIPFYNTFSITVKE